MKFKSLDSQRLFAEDSLHESEVVTDVVLAVWGGPACREVLPVTLALAATNRQADHLTWAGVDDVHTRGDP